MGIYELNNWTRRRTVYFADGVELSDDPTTEDLHATEDSDQDSEETKSLPPSRAPLGKKALNRVEEPANDRSTTSASSRLRLSSIVTGLLVFSAEADCGGKRASRNSGCPALSLPLCVYERIFMFLPRSMVTTLSLVCKEWSELIRHGCPLLWKTWLLQEYPNAIPSLLVRPYRLKRPYYMNPLSREMQQSSGSKQSVADTMSQRQNLLSGMIQEVDHSQSEGEDILSGMKRGQHDFDVVSPDSELHSTGRKRGSRGPVSTGTSTSSGAASKFPTVLEEIKPPATGGRYVVSSDASIEGVGKGARISEKGTSSAADSKKQSKKGRGKRKQSDSDIFLTVPDLTLQRTISSEAEYVVDFPTPRQRPEEPETTMGTIVSPFSLPGRVANPPSSPTDSQHSQRKHASGTASVASDKEESAMTAAAGSGSAVSAQLSAPLSRAVWETEIEGLLTKALDERNSNLLKEWHAIQNHAIRAVHSADIQAQREAEARATALIAEQKSARMRVSDEDDEDDDGIGRHRPGFQELYDPRHVPTSSRDSRSGRSSKSSARRELEQLRRANQRSVRTQSRQIDEYDDEYDEWDDWDQDAIDVYDGDFDLTISLPLGGNKASHRKGKNKNKQRGAGPRRELHDNPQSVALIRDIENMSFRPSEHIWDCNYASSVVAEAEPAEDRELSQRYYEQREYHLNRLHSYLRNKYPTHALYQFTDATTRWQDGLTAAHVNDQEEGHAQECHIDRDYLSEQEEAEEKAYADAGSGGLYPRVDVYRAEYQRQLRKILRGESEDDYQVIDFREELKKRRKLALWSDAMMLGAVAIARQTGAQTAPATTQAQEDGKSAHAVQRQVSTATASPRLTSTPASVRPRRTSVDRSSLPQASPVLSGASSIRNIQLPTPSFASLDSTDRISFVSAQARGGLARGASMSALPISLLASPDEVAAAAGAGEAVPTESEGSALVVPLTGLDVIPPESGVARGSPVPSPSPSLVTLQSPNPPLSDVTAHQQHQQRALIREARLRVLAKSPQHPNGSLDESKGPENDGAHERATAASLPGPIQAVGPARSGLPTSASQESLGLRSSETQEVKSRTGLSSQFISTGATNLALPSSRPGSRHSSPSLRPVASAQVPFEPPMLASSTSAAPSSLTAVLPALAGSQTTTHVVDLVKLPPAVAEDIYQRFAADPQANFDACVPYMGVRPLANRLYSAPSPLAHASAQLPSPPSSTLAVDLFSVGQAPSEAATPSPPSVSSTLTGDLQTPQQMQGAGTQPGASPSKAHSAAAQMSMKPNIPVLLKSGDARTAVSCIKVRDGRVCVGMGRDIKVHSASTGKRLVNFEPQSSPVTCLDFTSQLLVTGAEDCALRIYNWDSSECQRVTSKKSRHASTVTTVRLLRHSSQIVSTGLDQQVKLWSTETGACIAQYNNPEVITGPTGQVALGPITSSISLTPNLLVTGSVCPKSSADAIQRGLRQKFGESALTTLYGPHQADLSDSTHERKVSNLLFGKDTPESASIAASIAAASAAARNVKETTVKNSVNKARGCLGLWDLRVDPRRGGVVWGDKHLKCGFISSLALSRNEYVLAAGSSDGVVSLWDVRNLTSKSPLQIIMPASWSVSAAEALEDGINDNLQHFDRDAIRVGRRSKVLLGKAVVDRTYRGSGLTSTSQFEVYPFTPAGWNAAKAAAMTQARSRFMAEAEYFQGNSPLYALYRSINILSPARASLNDSLYDQRTLADLTSFHPLLPSGISSTTQASEIASIASSLADPTNPAARALAEAAIGVFDPSIANWFAALDLYSNSYSGSPEDIISGLVCVPSRLLVVQPAVASLLYTSNHLIATAARTYREPLPMWEYAQLISTWYPHSFVPGIGVPSPLAAYHPITAFKALSAGMTAPVLGTGEKMFSPGLSRIVSSASATPTQSPAMSIRNLSAQSPAATPLGDASGLPGFALDDHASYGRMSRSSSVSSLIEPSPQRPTHVSQERSSAHTLSSYEPPRPGLLSSISYYPNDPPANLGLVSSASVSSITTAAGGGPVFAPTAPQSAQTSLLTIPYMYSLAPQAVMLELYGSHMSKDLYQHSSFVTNIPSSIPLASPHPLSTTSSSTSAAATGSSAGSTLPNFFQCVYYDQMSDSLALSVGAYVYLWSKAFRGGSGPRLPSSSK